MMKLYRKVWLVGLSLAWATLVIQAMLATPPVRAAGPWYVGPGGSDGSACTSVATRCASINGALAKPGFVAGDTIRVAVGTYTGSGDEVVLLDNDVTLSGGWNSDFTAQSGMSTIDGESVRRGMTVNSGVTAIVERFLVRNGMKLTGGGMSGGGISNEGTLTLNDSSISDNTAECSISALYNTGTFTSNNCTINGNVAVNANCVGWAVTNSSAGIMTLNSTTISDNLDGGGIYNYGTLALNSSTVSGNTSTSGDGGGGLGNSGTLTLNSSTVSNNTAKNGGGIYNIGTLALNNSTVSGNTATQGSGGGIVNGWFASFGDVSINNSTVSGNMATAGGGISNGLGTVTLENSILAGNVGGNSSDCWGNIGSTGYNLIGNTSGCSFTPNTGDLPNLDPKLGPLAGSPGYHPLLSGSPAINAGNPAGCTDNLGNPLLTDQRGMPRVGRCDIGAYEYGLSVAKSAVGNYVAGDTINYIISLKNDTTTDMTDLSIIDTVPISMTYVPDSFSASHGTGGESGGVVTWNGSVPANTTTTVSFEGMIDDNAGCRFINNKAFVSAGASHGFEVQTSGRVDCVCSLTKATNNPILPIGPNGSWDDDDVWRPTVLKESSSYKMWYVADDGSNPPQIGLATSNDGLAWNKSSSNPVLSPGSGWEAGGLSGGSVIFDSGQYKLWYTGFDSNGAGRIGYATSPDGISWTKHGGNPVLSLGSGWDDADVMFPSVLKQGSTYHMWYEGNDGSGQSTHRIGHATSSDGLNWTKDPANPVLDIGPPGAWDWLSVYGPNVIQYNNTFILWYSGQTLPEAWQTGYALSTDGSNWTRQKLLIPEGPTGTFDNASADYAAVIADGSDFKVWYSGYNGTDYTIGYATAEICSAVGPAPLSSSIYLPVVLKAWDPRYPCPAYYTDNFSDPGSGWVVNDNSDRRYAYTDGQYQIWVKRPSYLNWSTPGAKATDFTAAVTARRASSNAGEYGIVFGINGDGTEWYQFMIGSNYYSLWKRQSSGWIALRNSTASSRVNTGTSWNRLKVIREGTSILLYVNGYHLTSISDGSFTGLRRIGLVAAAPSNGSIDARFDDFSLYPASCGVSAAGVGFEMGQPEIQEAPVPLGGDESP